jgi:signal transduction histidine kinase/CheY-like chemotaxis protein
MTDLVISNDKLGDRRTLGLLIERNPLPALLFDPQWLGVIAANAAAVSQYGYSKDEFRRLTMTDLVCDDDVGAFLRAIEPGAQHPETPPRCRHRRRDGSLLTIACRTDRLEFGGQSAILAIVEGIEGASDVTRDLALNGGSVVETMHPNGAYVVAEAPSDARVPVSMTRTKNEFLARLSHELRTPLNAVIGFSELLALQEGAADSNHARYVEHILEAGRHLLSLVDDVLDLQRVADRRIPLTPRPLELASFVASETTLLTPLLGKQSLTMLNDVPAGLMVSADVRCLRQALLNIATNAIKYNRPAGIVRWSASVVRPGFAVLKISDTGYGMSREQLPRLFQPFDRLGMEASSHPGRGLGLLIAKGLVEHMGGTLEVESRVGVGTHVLVELPLAEPHSLFGDLESNGLDLAMAELSARTAAADVPLRAQSDLMPTIRVLYVEDNRVNAMLFEAVLGARPDIELRIAETGWEALDIVDNWIPDVLVLDANLPDIHGVRLLRQMRELAYLKDTPAFMCSADALEEDVQVARAAGFSDYWTKPVDFNKVLADLRGLGLGGADAELR